MASQGLLYFFFKLALFYRKQLFLYALEEGYFYIVKDKDTPTCTYAYA
jgi:hypothetical protein